MILLLDTSTAFCKLTLIDGDERIEEVWEANRDLADGILTFLEDVFVRHNMTWHDIESVGVMKGPGSFTGLRIGMAVLNTLADTLQIPIVGATGESWQEICLDRLRSKQDERIVLPEYGREARITKPRK